MYFIASGAVEVKLDPNPVRLGSGDFFGEIALVTNLPRTADVVALGYCRLLTLQARDFTRLLAADGDLRQRIDAVAHERLGAAVQAAK
jgi:CPA1 family monovalent cation:H+ antiporter